MLRGTFCFMDMGFAVLSCLVSQGGPYFELAGIHYDTAINLKKICIQIFLNKNGESQLLSYRGVRHESLCAACYSAWPNHAPFLHTRK